MSTKINKLLTVILIGPIIGMSGAVAQRVTAGMAVSQQVASGQVIAAVEPAMARSQQATGGSGQVIAMARPAMARSQQATGGSGQVTAKARPAMVRSAGNGEVTAAVSPATVEGLQTNTASQPATLDQYIQEAFARNQSLQQRNFALDKSMYALQEARGMFMPQVSLLANYTKASGGRTIDVPVGDLINPVYQTLNELTTGPKLPMLSNQSIQLNPDNFYDAKLRTSLPLINTEIWYAQKIRREDISRQQAAVNVYKRQLVKDIKTAYHQYYQAARAVTIYNNALQLVQENIRVNESMLRNGVRNGTALTRSQAEREKTMAAITAAQNNQQNAKAYFNFLLNRPLTDSIVADSAALAMNADVAIDLNGGISSREELVQLDKTRNMALLLQKQQQSTFIPKLSTFLDLGSQAYNWRFNNTSRYYLLGVDLQWNIFTGGQRRARAQQAATDAATAKAAYDETALSLQLEMNTASNNYQTARSNYSSAQTQLQLAEKYYRDQLKVYKEGQLLYIELLDAQQQLTNARLESLQAYAQVQIAQAEIERAGASFPLGRE